MLILDDVHLLEGPLRDMFTVSIDRSDDLYKEVLGRIVHLCSYYSQAQDLFNDQQPAQAPEMLVFPDSADSRKRCVISSTRTSRTAARRGGPGR